MLKVRSEELKVKREISLKIKKEYYMKISSLDFISRTSNK
jgi:hypothetical protein